jgi:hypothetical protein
MRASVFFVMTLVFLVQTSFAEAPNQKVRAIYRDATALAAAINDEVWPGFDARRYMFTFSEAGAADPHIGFSPTPKDPKRHVFMLAGADYFGNQPLEDALSFVFHESFHAFQQDPTRPGARWRVENPFHLFDYAGLGARNQALFRLESRALQAALEAADRDQGQAKVRQFLAMRKLRQGELDPPLVEFEKGAESNEGLAEYAGTRAVLAGLAAVRAKRVNLAFATTTEEEFLRKKYAKLSTITRVGKNDRLKFYYTGSAQGLLLDRLAPGWKGKVQNERAAVQDLLAKAIHFPDPDWRTVADNALHEYGFDSVLKEEDAAAARKAAEGQKLLHSVRDKVGQRCIVDLAALGPLGGYRSFDPMNVTILGRRYRVHTRMLTIGEKGRYQADFEQPVVEDREKKQYETVCPAGEKLNILLDGQPLSLQHPEDRPVKKKLVLTAPHFRLEAEAGSVAVTSEGVVVRLAKQ